MFANKCQLTYTSSFPEYSKLIQFAFNKYSLPLLQTQTGMSNLATHCKTLYFSTYFYIKFRSKCSTKFLIDSNINYLDALTRIVLFIVTQYKRQMTDQIQRRQCLKFCCHVKDLIKRVCQYVLQE